jgi:hypothetical protein
MLELMKARGFTETTQAAYVRGVLGLCRHCGGRKPGAITLAEGKRLTSPIFRLLPRSLILAA